MVPGNGDIFSLRRLRPHRRHGPRKTHDCTRQRQSVELRGVIALKKNRWSQVEEARYDAPNLNGSESRSTFNESPTSQPRGRKQTLSPFAVDTARSVR